ncbi:hypothetical protein DAI22_03g183300 [Oryza sativa Japonica Group]|nr:hypothetical protein DAI22_03g183300 [Oryza sativa Japonica Group]
MRFLSTSQVKNLALYFEAHIAPRLPLFLPQYARIPLPVSPQITPRAPLSSLSPRPRSPNPNPPPPSPLLTPAAPLRRSPSPLGSRTIPKITSLCAHRRSPPFPRAPSLPPLRTPRPSPAPLPPSGRHHSLLQTWIFTPAPPLPRALIAVPLRHPLPLLLTAHHAASVIYGRLPYRPARC